MKLRNRLNLFALCIVLAAGVYVWSLWPLTTRMPESWVKWRLNAALPPKPPGGEWERRGAYLVAVSGCAMCHTPYSWVGPHGSRALTGGMRVRWNNDLGERVAMNLTPDPETGIGAWTEEDFIVAMKSGLYPDGRSAHWQAMPWDMHSNFSLDDMRAIYRYLRGLPSRRRGPSNPVRGEPPSSDTFYFGT